MEEMELRSISTTPPLHERGTLFKGVPKGKGLNFREEPPPYKTSRVPE